MNSTPLTEDWLKEVGFKWHQHNRQPSKHWLLWLGHAIPSHNCGMEDLGIEIAHCGGRSDEWFCWLRCDTAHRYHRFIHIRHLKIRQEVIDLVQSLSTHTWNPDNHRYGSVYSPEQMARILQDEQRLDHQIRRECPKWWSEIEEDDTRGRALPDHMEDARIFETQPLTHRATNAITATTLKP